MSKKILFLVNKLSVGGLEKVSVTIANELSKTKKVKLYSLKGDSYGYHFNKKLEYEHGGSLVINSLLHPILTIKVVRSKKLYDKKLLNFKQVKKDNDFKKLDSVVLSEADILFAKKIKKINKELKIVGWIHSTYDSYRDIYMKDSYREFLDNVSKLDTLVVLTKSDMKKFEKHNKNVREINNPLTMLVCKEQIVRNRIVKKIAFVGRLDYETKGLDYLLEFSKLIPNDCQIVIAGDGPDKNRFIEDIKKEKVNHKFLLKGVLQNKELENFYLEADIFVLTSRWEGFGLVLTEAMNFSLPVISFDSSGPREIIGNNNEFGILVPNGDVNQLASSVNMLISDNELYNHYSKQSYERVKDFDLEKISKNWLCVLNRTENEN